MKAVVDLRKTEGALLSYGQPAIPEIPTDSPPTSILKLYTKSKAKRDFLSVSCLVSLSFTFLTHKINSLKFMISKHFLPGQLYGRSEARLEKRVQLVQAVRKGVKSTNSAWEREWAESEGELPQRWREYHYQGRGCT